MKRIGVLLLLATTGCGSTERAQTSIDAPPDTIRLLAYNIHHAEGMDDTTDLGRIADFITALEPDLVTLQEIDSVAERTGRVDQAATLAELTGMHHAFGRFMPYQGGAYGMAVLSRWPIQESANLRLTDGLEPRTAVSVRVRTPGANQELVLVGIHLYATEQERLAQATDLETYLETETAPVILAGDFNSEPGSIVMDQLAGGWHILDKGADHFTFSSFAPEKEIDFVLLRPADRFQVIDHRPLDEPVLSDHRPIWTELILNPS